MQAKDAFAAAGTAEKVAAALYALIAGNRGSKGTVAMGLQQNIELIRLYAESGSDPACFRKRIPKGGYT